MQIFSFYYHDFFDLFNITIFKILVEYASHNYVIDIEKNMLFFESIYNLLMFKLKVLRKYLNKNLMNIFLFFYFFFFNKCMQSKRL